MSRQLAISSTFSVLLMAAFALLGPNAVQVPLDGYAAPGAYVPQVLALPTLPPLLPR